MGAIRYRAVLTRHAHPAGHGRDDRSRRRFGLVGLVLLGVLAWSLVATASSQARPLLQPSLGPAAATTVSVLLSPASIKADGGTSASTASATIPGSGLLDTVAFSSSDPGQVVSGASFDALTSTWSATIKSSTTPGSATITVTDSTVSASGQGTLIQYGPAKAVSVALAPASIVADGSMTTTATATVTDINHNLVPGDTVNFTDPAGNSVPGADPQNTGIYTASLTSTKTAGPVTVTATDTSVTPNVIGTAPLTQTAGPATTVGVALLPASIVANGSSTTTAVATVTDLNNNRVSGDTVSFTGPAGNPVPGIGQGNGIYTAILTSSTTLGPVTVTATDTSPAANGANGSATLTQTPAASTTMLSVLPAQPVTNQTETLIATVTAGLGSPSGTVAFQSSGVAIPGCASVPVAPSTGTASTAACQTSFAAANSPVALRAVFTSTAGANLGSGSPVDNMSVGQDSTSTNLTASSTNPIAGSSVTYLAAVVPKHAGSAQPSGSIRFSDGNHTLGGCGSVPLQGNPSSGSVGAICRVSFGAVGPRAITAHYLGDASFTASGSPSLRTVVNQRPPPQRLLVTLAWTFLVRSTYTAVGGLVASDVPAGASFELKCHGHGCPYIKRVIAVSNSKRCKTTKNRRCVKLSPTTIGLSAAFFHHRLKPGTKLTVEILRPGWIGKYYRFTILAAHRPRQFLSCLPPGGTKPGVGC